MVGIGVCGGNSCRDREQGKSRECSGGVLTRAAVPCPGVEVQNLPQAGYNTK